MYWLIDGNVNQGSLYWEPTEWKPCTIAARLCWDIYPAKALLVGGGARAYFTPIQTTFQLPFLLQHKQRVRIRVWYGIRWWRLWRRIAFLKGDGLLPPIPPLIVEAAKKVPRGKHTPTVPDNQPRRHSPKGKSPPRPSFELDLIRILSSNTRLTLG